MILLYAIIDATPRADVRGLEDQPVEFLSVGSIGAVFSRHADHSIGATAQNVVTYEQVLEQLMRDGPLLPFRFGTCFSDDSPAGTIIQKHQARFVDALEQVRGCVEMGVRAAIVKQPPRELSGAASGREYMMSRLAARRETERLTRLLHEPLAARARQSTQRGTDGNPILLSGAYLVPRDDVKAFQQAVQELAESHPQLRILCTGPWPPYHFVPELSEAQPR